ncbi:copper amine oxidase N-terminal domain-containing protein [Paenibacillus bouchesdurhonensis]|uniref:copper amine oxidase N-terminal domain-containing protein n=1 Tax=Paenibacillus bouchesdurhonensis TaxID=1870990 RepID=UPI0038996124
MFLNRWIKCLIGSVIFGSIFFVSSSAYAAPAVFVNGEYQHNAITIEGRIWVPIRALTDQEWLVYAYDPKTRIASVHDKDNTTTVELRVGEKTATVNGKKVQLEAEVVNKNGLTYVPLRFIAETFGAHLEFNGKDDQVIVRTPMGQAQYEILIRGDLTEARKIALKLTRVDGEAPQLQFGESYNHFYYTFPEGEALRFTFSAAGYSEHYYEINDEGLAIHKWQMDHVANREWGKKPAFKSYVYFLDEFMASLFTYGMVDAQGNDKELGKFYYSELKEGGELNKSDIP